MSTKIKITDIYSVDVDENNHKLLKRIPEHTNPDEKIIKERFETLGYFPNLTQCLNALVREDLLNAGEISIDDYLKLLGEISSKYHAVF